MKKLIIPAAVYFISLLLGINFFACNETKTTENQSGKKDTLTVNNIPEETKVNYQNSAMLADTITYPVLIKNPDPADDWTTLCLKRLNNKALSDAIFKAVYDGKLVPYDYDKDTPMSIADLKTFETKFARNRIAKIQFIESWYFDDKSAKFIKQVYALTLAYEFYNSDGSTKGYQAGFKVYFSEPKNKNAKDVAQKN